MLNENKKIYDVIVLGAGPVGLYATFLAGYLKLNCLCLEADEIVGGQPLKVYPNKYIYDFPGYQKILASNLINTLKTQAEQYPEYSSIQTKVKIIGYEQNEAEDYVVLIDENANHYYAKKVILSVGIGAFEPVKLTDFSESLSSKKVRYCLESEQEYTDKNILILGGGDAALDYALHIKKFANPKTLSLVHRKDKFRADGLGLEDLENAGIKVYLSTNLANWTENYCLFKDQNEQEIKIDYDLLLVQYGLKSLGSSVHNFSEFEKKANKFIVNKDFETNVKNFYAIGNCAYYETRINLILTGMSEATIILQSLKKTLKANEKSGW